jgi:WbqC-like protein
MIMQYRKVAIHQPDFFPWIGFFHKLSVANTYIFFDHVFAPRGKSWASRNKILLRGEPQWLTIPVRKSGKGPQRYFEIEINYDRKFDRKHLGTISQAYEMCPFFDEIFPSIEDIYHREYQYLTEFNKHFIRNISNKLQFKTTFLSSRSMCESHPEVLSYTGNELVLNLCLRARADEYISGEGCLDFIEPETFMNHEVRFFVQRFRHKVYPQNSRAGFISHLSILDALFNVGIGGVSKLISGDMLTEVQVKHDV